jgi:hypothetical protein
MCKMRAGVFRTTTKFMPNSEMGPRNPLEAFKAQVKRKGTIAHIQKSCVFFLFSVIHNQNFTTGISRTQTQ